MAPKKEKGDKTVVKTMDDFAKKYADRRINVKEVAEHSGFRPTGSLLLDQKLGGGLPKGKPVELYGPPGGGKSTVAAACSGIALAQGGRVAYFDLERGLDLMSEGVLDSEGAVTADALLGTNAVEHKRKRTSWLRTNGIDPEHPNFHIYDPWSGEELFTMLDDIVANDLFDIAVVDSVPAILPRAVLEGQPGDATYGARAKLLAEEMPRLMRLYSGNHNTTVIFINQVRENIGAQVKSQKSTGGYALDHFVRTKIKFQRIGRDEKGDDVLTKILWKAEKNLAGAYATGELIISAKRGVDLLSELLDFGIDFGYVRVKGSWHYFFDAPVEADAFNEAWAKKKIAELPGYVGGYNGSAAALEFMFNNGWKEKLLPVAMKVFG